MKNIKKLFLFWSLVSAAIIALSIPASQAVVIYQVLYDPTGSENGGEAIELFNEEEEIIDISGWVIKTKSSERDAILPQGSFLFPGAYYLIADTNWNVSKDDPSWRSADYEEALTLSNSDAGIALKNGSTIIDAVGWGSVADPELFEGTPANGSRSGESLLRVQETDNNIADFVASSASFPERPSQYIELIIPVSTSQGSIIIEQVNITDDLPDQGIQILPIAGGKRTIEIVAAIRSNTSPTVTAEIDTGQEIEEIDLEEGTSGSWRGRINLSYTVPHGTFFVTIRASLGGEQSVLNTSFEWLSLLALHLDTDQLVFPESSPGSVVTLLGDNDRNTRNVPTITNIGNTPLNIGLRRTPLQDHEQFFLSGRVICSLDNNFQSAMSAVVGEEMRIIDRELEPAETSPLGVQIEIPSSASSTLLSAAMITAVSAE